MAFACILCLAQTALATAHAGAGPNVVFILIDDLGYGDLSCTGNRVVTTANIDRLAAEGTRFTQFYVNSPICSASRVAFLTGHYPARHRIHSFLASREQNRSHGMPDWLDPAAPSVARAFQQAGYATAHFGKWRLGGGRDVGDAPLPQEYGFDESFTSFEGLGDRVLPPGRLSEQSAKLGRGRITHAPKHKLTEIYVDRTIDFVRRHRDGRFYVHLWLDDVHDPHQPRPDLLDKYQRFSDKPPLQKFYAVLDEMDRQLGRLFDAIDELELAEQTLVLLTGDNGPTAWPHYYEQGFEPPGDTAGFRGRKWSLYEGGIRQPLLVRWKGVIPAGRVNDDAIVTAIDFLPTLSALANIVPPQADLDGEDASLAFLGRPFQRAKPLCWEYGRSPRHLRPYRESDQSPNLAIRDGRWKLLTNADGSRTELYDFAASTNERDNVATEHPEIIRRLTENLERWQESWPSR